MICFLISFQYRAERGDSDAVERLKRFACLPIGTREARFGLLRPLHDKGLLPYGEPLELWDGERVTQVKLVSTEIRREPEPSNLPKDDARRFELAKRLQGRVKPGVGKRGWFKRKDA